MAQSGSTLARSGFGVTMRRDAWWVELIPVVVILGAFTVYATWRTFENNYYEFGPYLSPFYSPLIKPKWWPLSPAILILWAPLGFRATCYYYRKAFRYRHRFAGIACEHCFADWVRSVVSFAQAHRRRQRRLLFLRSRGRAAAWRLARRFIFE